MRRESAAQRASERARELRACNASVAMTGRAIRHAVAKCACTLSPREAVEAGNERYGAYVTAKEP
jgi:hypothetical protein